MVQPIRKYKDLDMNMPVHPNTQDLVYIKDEAAIKRSVKNIILTGIYERHFDDSFGSQLKASLFEPLSYFTAISIQSSIEAALNQYEPRISLISTSVLPEEENYGYKVAITFKIENQMRPVTVEFFLERIR